MKLKAILTAIAAALALQGCFTGVESTPRITAGDVRRATPPSSPEEHYFDSVVAEPFARWMPGKLFHVADSKIRLLFGTSLSADRELAGHEIRYAGAREGRSITAAPVTDLLFTEPEHPADTLIYRINAPLADLRSGATPVEIPFTVEQTVVDKASRLLLGKTFYIITRNRRTASDNIVPGDKFVAVTIDSVTPGTPVNPVSISFTDSSGRRDRLFLSAGDAQSSPRKFASMFAFDNPRLRYPQITDENWELIVKGKVAGGMTREECRLSLGAPASVDRAPGYSYLHEVWTYENGIYLIFEDGLLVSFRH